MNDEAECKCCPYDPCKGDARGCGYLWHSMMDTTCGTNGGSIGASVVFNRDSGEQVVLKTPPCARTENTRVATIDLGFEYLDPAPAGQTLWEGLARITWGVGGSSIEAIVDWKRGVQLSVPAACISISAFNDQDDDPPAPARVRLTALLGWGNRAARSYPTRSFRFGAVLAGGNTGILPIPAFSYAFQLATTNVDVYAAAGTLFEIFGDAAGATLVQVVTGTDLRAALLTEGVKLHGFGRFFRVTNGAGLTRSLNPFFALSL